ncbi:MAG: hypothetical protein AB8I08_35510 [Sandaracinaceae bacterium]
MKIRQQQRGFRHRLRTAATVTLVALAMVGCDDEGDPDAGPAQVDAGPSDAGALDAGTNDSGTTDSGTTDAGLDAGTTDSGPGDAGRSDAGDIDAGSDAGTTTECSTTVDGAGSDFVEVCGVDGPVRHVRIEAVQLPPTHASMQVLFGAETAPAGPNEPLALDQLKVLLYGGGTPFPGPAMQVIFGDVSETLEVDATVLASPTTVCFDVHPGSVDTAPAFAFWIDGVNGADCEDASTLSVASTSAMRAAFRGATGAIDDSPALLARNSAGLVATPTVVASTTPALTATAIREALACTTTWADNTDWQAVCAPDAGRRGHVRIAGIEATAANSYWYFVAGEADTPTGNPMGSANTFILTGGQSNSGGSWTWFRFGESGSTPPGDIGTAGLYVGGPSTVCLDLGERTPGTPGSAPVTHVVFWASGAGGADCDDRSTLTLENALYDSETDPAFAAIWDGLIGTDNVFIKTNNGTVQLTGVTVTAEPAVL